MTTQGIDTATSQAKLDFAFARSQGYESCYVKLGGDNVPRYIAPHYVAQVNKARAAGFRLGHYWVPSAAKDAAGAADFFCSSLHGWTSADFVVLDNESLDGARRYDDAGAAAWVNRVKARLGIGGKQVKVYLGLADARSNSWPQTLATGCDFIIAAYSYKPFTYDLRGHIPEARNNGHQYSSSVKIGGITTDVNAWKDGAFDYAPSGPIVPAPAGSTPAGASSGRRYTTTEQDGIPGSIYWTMIQSEGNARGWYTPRPDGIPGPNTYRTEARLKAAILNEYARNHGLSRTSTEEDGIPGKIYYTLAQKAGKEFEYAGKVDGITGPQTEKSLFKRTAYWLNRYGR